MLRTGVFALTFSEHAIYPYEKLLSENLVGGFRNTLGLEYVADQDDEGRYMRALDRKLEWLGRQFRAVQEGGGTPWLELGAMPRWLSADPNFRGSTHTYWRNLPPKSLPRWSELIRHVVDYLNNRLGLKVRYSVWTEPDVNQWYASMDDFVDLYEWSVRGILSADPDAVIGAPGVFGWRTPHDRGPPGVPFLRDFLQRAGARSMTVGKRRYPRLPLDFVVFHVLDSELPEEHPMIQTTVRSWLTSSGYSASTPFWVGEWSLVKPARFEEGAAYAAATLATWSRLPSYQLGAYTSLFDQTAGWIVGLFEGSFDSLRTNPYVTRATYNVFKAYSRLGGHGTADHPRLVSVDTGHAPLVYAVATHARESSTTRVIITNFAPTRDSLRAFLRLQPEARELRADEGRLRECIGKLRQRTAPGVLGCVRERIQAIPDPAKRARMEQALQRVQGDLTMIRQRQQQPVTINLRVDNLGVTGPAEVTHYRIDHDHANWARLRETQAGKALLRDIATAQHDAESLALEAATESLRGAGYPPGMVQALRTHILVPYLQRTATTDGRFLTPVRVQGAVHRQVTAIVGDARAQQTTVDVLHAAEQVLVPVFRDLYYRGRARTPAGRQLSIPVSVEMVNRDPEVSLEGSATRERVSVPANHSLAASLILEPYSVHLLEIAPVR